MNKTLVRQGALTMAEETFLGEFHVLELWMPQRITIPNCNLKCKHCYVPKGGMTDQVMSPKEYFSALLKISDRVESSTGRFDVVFPGMEPLLPQNKSWFRSLLSLASSLNRGSVGITTNGTLLDDEIVDFLSENARNMQHPLTVNVSLDGDEKTHDLQRGKNGLWKKTIAGLKLLAKAGFCNLVTNSTITNVNHTKLADIAVISSECGAKISAFHPFEIATGSNLEALKLKDLVTSIQSLVEVYHRDERLKHVVLEFEASNAGVFFRLFELGLFQNWKLIEDNAGFLFLINRKGNRQFLVSLMFYPHHFIRTMRLMHNGRFASCRSMACHEWKTVGHWNMTRSELKTACLPFLADIWQEYIDSTRQVSRETFDRFEDLVKKGGD